MNLEELYLNAKENPETSCLEWQKSCYPDGYGQVRYQGKQQSAHRVAYMILHEVTLNSKQLVCHTCDNRKCVNVQHLFLGDYFTNNHDTISKGRDRKATGENHGMSKLTREIVEQMRIRNNQGESIRSLSREFSVAFETAREAIQGKTWI